MNLYAAKNKNPQEMRAFAALLFDFEITCSRAAEFQ